MLSIDLCCRFSDINDGSIFDHENTPQNKGGGVKGFRQGQAATDPIIKEKHLHLHSLRLPQQ